MPRREDIQKVLLIGSGPIVIGQACEFDYSGTQACKALREEGYEVVLVNSNPATIMTDPDVADRTYVEPITTEILERIVARERPDVILPTLGGQTALNAAVALAERGVLATYRVELIGASLETIRKAEDRDLFKRCMQSIGMAVPKSGVARTLAEARAVVDQLGFPVILRPAFTLGGTGGSTAYNFDELEEFASAALAASPIGEVLVEESIAGWKEFELEVVRDRKDNVVIVCSIENMDPMGVHTGDSITVAPVQTLTDREYQRMRDAAIAMIREIGVETGGCNVQFAVHPGNGSLVAIEVNPRVSRSSALASKATGFPIAKIAAKLAVGYTLDEIRNDITQVTPASFEPTLDYVVVKIPRFNFEKFPGVDERLGPQMKSVGEAMAIGGTFKEAFQKALRSLEIGRFGLGADGKDEIDPAALSDGERSSLKDEMLTRLRTPRWDNVFRIRHALRLGATLAEVADSTRMDPWFLDQIAQIVEMEEEIRAVAAEGGTLDAAAMRRAKRCGFSDVQLGHLLSTSERDVRSLRERLGVRPAMKTVDTCAAEFAAHTPYHYSTYDGVETEVMPPTGRKKILILGGGPNRIGQGIEFDYCCVHAVQALAEAGYETILQNSNPETVSTDYDTAHRLYFEPLTLEDILNVVAAEEPAGVLVQFGGQTPLKLALALQAAGVPILGTTPAAIDRAEDRQKFLALAEKIGLTLPPGGTALSAEEALRLAQRVGYPLLVRPSYVLGGRAMRIVYDAPQLQEYMKEALDASPGHPVQIDRFLEDAFEFDVDAISDGERCVIAGVMQHIEEAGIHSGDSACVLPPYRIRGEDVDTMRRQMAAVAAELDVRGLINAQFAVQNDVVYMLEVNPRASRTVPFVSKAVGRPLAKIAARVMAGETLESLGFTEEPPTPHVSVKEVVLPFNKLFGTDPFLGPEMKSTGEVMGIADNFGTAFAKSQMAAGDAIPMAGSAFISVNDRDHENVVPIARELARFKFRLFATRGTARALEGAGLACKTVPKLHEGRPHVLDLIANGEIDLVIATPLGKSSRADEAEIRRIALRKGVPVLSTLSAAAAAVRAVRALSDRGLEVRSLQEYHPRRTEPPATDGPPSAVAKAAPVHRHGDPAWSPPGSGTSSSSPSLSSSSPSAPAAAARGTDPVVSRMPPAGA
ncbi:MAG: carbamoyl-phosphate synthase large subunit [bacterium]